MPRWPQFESHLGQLACELDDVLLVPIGDADEDLARFRQHDPGRLALGKRDREPLADAHHFAGAPHFRAEHDVDAGELAERKDAFLDRHVRRNRLAR